MQLTNSNGLHDSTAATIAVSGHYADRVHHIVVELKQISGSTGYPFLFYYPDIENELKGYCEWIGDIHWRTHKVEIA